MVKLARCIVEITVNEYGEKDLLERLSDPWFFQSLSCVLGYDWHSSGTTTVTCGALKEAISPEEHGIAVAGGKGKASRKTPNQLENKGFRLGLNNNQIQEMKYASKMTAKVDNCLIQDGYQIYHHSFIFSEKGEWIVIQQGINEKERYARRYHWPLKHTDYVEEPHNAIMGMNCHKNVLNITSKESRENRKACLDLTREPPQKLKKYFRNSLPEKQRTLDDWNILSEKSKHLVMPRNINWDKLKKIYDYHPCNYEELVSLRGIGPSTIRGLSLVAELVFGQKASWRDPVRYSFAFGGKDGVPFPVKRKSMDQAIDLLKTGIKTAPIKKKEITRALRKLKECAPKIPQDDL
jgi:hypothetical protein